MVLELQTAFLCLALYSIFSIPVFLFQTLNTWKCGLLTYLYIITLSATKYNIFQLKEVEKHLYLSTDGSLQ